MFCDFWRRVDTNVSENIVSIFREEVATLESKGII
jgi:hypothetical protein